MAATLGWAGACAASAVTHSHTDARAVRSALPRPVCRSSTGFFSSLPLTPASPTQPPEVQPLQAWHAPLVSRLMSTVVVALTELSHTSVDQVSYRERHRRPPLGRPLTREHSEANTARPTQANERRFTRTTQGPPAPGPPRLCCAATSMAGLLRPRLLPSLFRAAQQTARIHWQASASLSLSLPLCARLSLSRCLCRSD